MEQGIAGRTLSRLEKQVIDWPFLDLERGKYGAIYADPPWSFECWSEKGTERAADNHYDTMVTRDIATLPVQELAAPDCAMFMWVCWPTMKDAFELIEAWASNTKPVLFLGQRLTHVRSICFETTPMCRSVWGTGPAPTARSAYSPPAESPSVSTPTCARAS